MSMGTRLRAMRIVWVPPNPCRSRKSSVSSRIRPGSGVIAAVDAQVRARHVAREIGCQEMHATRDFSGMRQSAHRNAGGEFAKIVREVAAAFGEYVIHHAGVDLA